jgi:hypothetical protein
MTSHLSICWYQLVESSTGQPYNEATSVDQVSVASDADVDDLKEAVKDANPNNLSSLDASDLVVYKNKDAFDKRNVAKDKEEPLEEDSLIRNLGATEEEALIVVVPSLPLDVVHESNTMKRRRQLAEDDEDNFIQILQQNIGSPSEFAMCKPIGGWSKFLRHRDCLKQPSTLADDEDNFITILQHQMGSPSEFAICQPNNGWSKFLRDHPGKIISHRDCLEQPSTPLCLLNSTFHEFIQDVHNIRITSEDCLFTAELIETMCEPYPFEHQRARQFIRLFSSYTDLDLVSIPSKMDGSTISTDGSLAFRCNGALYCNLQVATGNDDSEYPRDPYMQNMAHYIQHLPKDAASSNQYPCFLLVLYDTSIAVYGIINTDKQIICDPLTPIYPFFYKNMERGKPIPNYLHLYGNI